MCIILVPNPLHWYVTISVFPSAGHAVCLASTDRHSATYPEDGRTKTYWLLT